MDQLRDKLIRDRDLDISCLMPGTVERVLDERMEATGASDADAYVRLLDADYAEYDALVRDLVRPTDRFFGDDALTDLLRDYLLPQMLDRKRPGERVRVWVPNSGMGYLAYDIALLLWKLLGGRTELYDLKIIATDSDEACARIARFQDYPPDRFEYLADEGWPLDRATQGRRIHADVRRLLVIGEHDPIARPPYPRINLIVCRGLLPLLDATRRTQLKSRLVYSLVLGGKLVLGRGEILGFESDEASPGKPFAVFTKQVAHPFELGTVDEMLVSTRGAHADLLDRIQWPVVVVRSEGQIVHANQSASRQFAGGEAIEGRNLADLNISEPERQMIMETARDALSGARPVAITKIDGWAGSSVPLPGDVPGMAAVVLISTVTPKEPVGEAEIDAASAVKSQVASEAAETVAEMWSYDEEVRRLRTQAASITDSLYTRTEQLSLLREEVESRNAELQIANQELREAVKNREEAEREIRVALDREHRIADTLQKALLAPVPEQIEGFTLAARYVPAFTEAEVAGDFYHTGWLADGRFFAALGDVAGKGLDAAVYAYMAKYMLLAYVHETPEPDRLLPRLNDGLCAHSEDSRFVTLAYLLFDLKTGVIHYGSAGHEPAIYCSPSGGKTTTLFSTGTVLGVLSDQRFEMQTIELEPGGLLLLYTDGLSDAGIGEMRLNREGIAALMAGHCGEAPVDFLNVLYDAALTIGHNHLTDDATAIVIKRTEE